MKLRIVAQKDCFPIVLAIRANIPLGMLFHISKRQFLVLFALLQEEVLGVKVQYSVEENEWRVSAELFRLPQDLLLDATRHETVLVETYLVACGDLVKARLELVENEQRTAAVEEDVLDAVEFLLEEILYAQANVVDRFGRIGFSVWFTNLFCDRGYFNDF